MDGGEKEWMNGCGGRDESKGGETAQGDQSNEESVKLFLGFSAADLKNGASKSFNSVQRCCNVQQHVYCDAINN